MVDWRRGLREALASAGHALDDAHFDRIIDAQGRDEQAGYRPYHEITARSLIDVLGVAPDAAAAIGRGAGRWPLFPDSAEGMRALQTIAPCCAMTNSDVAHGDDVQGSLGLKLSHWITAEEVRAYKPAPSFWREVSRRVGRPLDRSWFHVSAYADYDLDVARSLGLTTVFVPRAHSRPGPADLTCESLVELAIVTARAAERPET